jgi:hypothetical protein
LSTVREQRAEFLDWLEATTKRIEATAERLKDPSTAEAKQLGVRAGRRMVDKLWKKLDALRQHGEPPRHYSAPTREREHAAGEGPSKELVYEGGQAAAVSHRFVWPVQRLHSLHITNARQYHAAARFRAADDRRGGNAGTASYGDGGRAADPTRKLPITPEQEIAAAEFRFVWTRLEDELKALAWILILQRPLPGDVEPLSIVEVGKRYGSTNNEAHARWFAHGMLKVLCIRLSTIYAIHDNHRAKEQEQAAARAAAQLKVHQQRVPLTRLKETA